MVLKTKAIGIAALVAALSLYTKPAVSGALVEKYQSGEEMALALYDNKAACIDLILEQFAPEKLLEKEVKEGDNKLYVIANDFLPYQKSTKEKDEAFVNHPEQFDINTAAGVHLYGTLNDLLASPQYAAAQKKYVGIVIAEIDVKKKEMRVVEQKEK